jgi:hypothetical protein
MLPCMQIECPRPHKHYEDVGTMSACFLQGVGGVRRLLRRTARIQNISHLLHKEETDTSSYCSVNVGSNLVGFFWRTVLRAPCICFRERDNGFHALNSLV